MPRGGYEPCTVSLRCGTLAHAMGFPEFEPNRKKVLFFCRGRGSGHAIPDIEITKELLTLRPDVEVRFVSYATGATTLAELGFQVIDLGLPELNSLLDVIVLATKLTAWLQPDLVVAHEEFGALLAARVFDKPAIFLTDWFVDGDRITMAALRFADQILFIDKPGYFEEPPQAKGRVTYVGPILRRFEYSLADRSQARRELGLSDDAVVISVLPGSHATEARAPIADLVLRSFDLLDSSTKFLVWVAGSDTLAIRNKAGARDDVIVKERDWKIDRLMVASDVVITKANRKTVLELESLGIPSVALSMELNPIDDARTRSCESVTFRLASEMDAELLASDISRAMSRGPFQVEKPRPEKGATIAARQIAAVLGTGETKT
jgi:UDP-N-acetylglucosamine:LPS N-acetylglucosamine transferase